MTKTPCRLILAAIAVMMQEEGRLSVDDPVKKHIYLLMIQRADMGDSDASEIRREFQNAA